MLDIFCLLYLTGLERYKLLDSFYDPKASSGIVTFEVHLGGGGGCWSDGVLWCLEVTLKF